MPESLQSFALQVLKTIANPKLGQNPYLETARLLKAMLQPPVVQWWALWLSRLMVVAFVLLLLQAVHILYLRIKAHRFYVFRLNTLGLIKIEIINISTCGYLIYCVLTITDRIFREVVWAGFHDQSRQIVLFGTKFIVLLACGWVVWWACVCHYALQKLKGFDDDFRNGKPIKVRILVWIANGVFVALMCWPIVPVLWAFLNINAQYIMISDIVTPIRKEMLRLAPSYSPSTYTQLQLLSRLITFTNISPHVIKLGRSVWQGLTVYLVSLVILCVVWIPFLVSSHREKKVQSDKIEPVSRAPRRGSDVSYLMKRQLDIVRRHTALVYIIVVLHVPALACALSFQSQVFFADPLWWASIELGLDLPFSLLGNLALFLLRLLVEKQATHTKATPSHILLSFPSKQEENN